MSNYLELLSLCQALYDITTEEYKYISHENIEENELEVFQNKKRELKSSIEKQMENIVFDVNEKSEIKNIFEKTYEIELSIGKIYAKKMDEIRHKMVNLNKEKKLQEVYAKSGMNFGADNSLKDNKKI